MQEDLCVLGAQVWLVVFSKNLDTTFSLWNWDLQLKEPGQDIQIVEPGHSRVSSYSKNLDTTFSAGGT